MHEDDGSCLGLLAPAQWCAYGRRTRVTLWTAAASRPPSLLPLWAPGIPHPIGLPSQCEGGREEWRFRARERLSTHGRITMIRPPGGERPHCLPACLAPRCSPSLARTVAPAEPRGSSPGSRPGGREPPQYNNVACKEVRSSWTHQHVGGAHCVEGPPWGIHPTVSPSRRRPAKRPQGGLPNLKVGRWCRRPPL